MVAFTREPMMDIPRFDVIFERDGVRLDYHFCREWDDKGGCYGTDPNHGYTFDEAKKEVADYYRKLAEYWDDLTLEEWNN